MKPSFQALFRRSRFCRDNSFAEDDQQGQMQRERFAVPAIAFCMKYDREFKRAFLKEICEWDLSDPESVSAEIEPEDCVDFLLASKGRVTVIEFKIGAELEPHQNPAESTRFLDDKQTPIGYGKQIAELYKGYGGSICYIVISHEKRFEKLDLQVNSARIVCINKTWSDVGSLPTESEIAKDLFDCLGSLGVREKKFRIPAMKYTEKLVLGSQTVGAAKTYEVLKHTIEAMEIDQDFVKPDISFTPEDAYFGMKFERRPNTGNARDTLSRLQKLVNPKPEDKYVCWVGYQQKGSQPTELSVWLYCDSDSQDVIYGHCEAAMIDVAEAKVRKDHTYVVVACDHTKSSGDRLWFQKVLSRIIQENKSVAS